jgi:branched-chain amino acid transport system permease protein
MFSESTLRRAGWAIVALLLIGVALAPWMLSGYWVRVLTGIFMYAVFTQSINIISGYTGYPAFGNVVFFGTGAYSTAVLMAKYAVPFVPAVVLGMLISVVIAALIGPAILRLRGGYFAIGTLGIMFTLRDLVTTSELTGGSSGIRLPVAPWSPDVINQVFYFSMAGLMLAGSALTWWISRSKLGYGLRAIRDSVDAAEVLGVATTWYRVVAWCISALVAAAAGGVYAYWLGFLEPQYAFDIMISVKGFLMMIVGGGGTILGPIIGAVFIELLSELVWGNFLRAHLLVLGTAIMLVAMYLPAGIPSLWPKLSRWLLRPAKAQQPSEATSR